MNCFLAGPKCKRKICFLFDNEFYHLKSPFSHPILYAQPSSQNSFLDHPHLTCFLPVITNPMLCKIGVNYSVVRALLDDHPHSAQTSAPEKPFRHLHCCVDVGSAPAAGVLMSEPIVMPEICVHRLLTRWRVVAVLALRFLLLHFRTTLQP